MKRAIWVIAALLMLPLASGCDREGPAERMGDEIDDAANNAGNAINDAADELEDETR